MVVAGDVAGGERQIERERSAGTRDLEADPAHLHDVVGGNLVVGLVIFGLAAFLFFSFGIGIGGQ